MSAFKLIVAICLVASLAACGSVGGITRGAKDGASTGPKEDLTKVSANWSVANVRVTVPETLKVSEANRYYPIGDIVWRGEPFGDRKAQVAKIMDDAMTQGVAHLDGAKSVFFDVVLLRFHSISEKTRTTIGGVHNIEYTLQVTDAATGQAMHGPHFHEISLDALGGDEAFQAERKGQTQKVRITQHVIGLMRAQFPGRQFAATRAHNIQASGTMLIEEHGL